MSQKWGPCVRLRSNSGVRIMMVSELPCHALPDSERWTVVDFGGAAKTVGGLICILVESEMFEIE